MTYHAPLRKGKKTLLCAPDPRWPAEPKHEQCMGWANPGVEVTYCECDCHDTRNPRRPYNEAADVAFPERRRLS